MKTFSQQLRQSFGMASVGDGNPEEDHVLLVTSTVGVTWDGFSTQFALDAGFLTPGHELPCGYIYCHNNSWTCHTWWEGKLNYRIDNASEAEFVRYIEHLRPSVLLVSMDSIDDIVNNLRLAGHKRVSGVSRNHPISSGNK